MSIYNICRGVWCHVNEACVGTVVAALMAYEYPPCPLPSDGPCLMYVCGRQHRPPCGWGVGDGGGEGEGRGAGVSGLRLRDTTIRTQSIRHGRLTFLLRHVVKVMHMLWRATRRGQCTGTPGPDALFTLDFGCVIVCGRRRPPVPMTCRPSGRPPSAPSAWPGENRRADSVHRSPLPWI